MSGSDTIKASPVLVVGAGIMGAGIAQVAAQAGQAVFLFDLRVGAAVRAKERLRDTLDRLVTKGKLTRAEVDATLARIEPIEQLAQGASAGVAIEAIVESLDAKQALMRQLEVALPSTSILATNTSSISVTAIAKGLANPGRVVGMHFFNPVPLMKLVEVVHGLQTEQVTADAVFELAQHWGKVPVHARSTPGFIVNRIARPFYAETLAILQERGARVEEVDACLMAAGFRMGPCALMDLIGHDTNLAVTSSVYAANFFDKRFIPSIVQQELVDGGLLGRKSGQGFYNYGEGSVATLPLPASGAGAVSPRSRVIVHGVGPHAAWFVESVGRITKRQVEREVESSWIGLSIEDVKLAMTDGRTAYDLAAAGVGSNVAVFDRFDPKRVSLEIALPLAFSIEGQASAQASRVARDWLGAMGFHPVPMKDLPGLVVARTMAMLINEAADAVWQGVCSQAAADSAMKLGVNYPKGPFEWLRDWAGTTGRGAAGVTAMLDALDSHYRGERYRASPLLRRQAHWTIPANKETS